MNIVDILLKFEQEQSMELLVSDGQTDIVILRVIASELLSWMKLQYKRKLRMEKGKKTSLKPLVLNMSYPWCQALSGYVETERIFRESFEISDDKLDFIRTLPEEYSSYAFKTAYEKYNPQMILY